MVKFIWARVKSWFLMMLLIMAIAAVGRDADLAYIKGIPYHTITNDWSSVFVWLIKSPFLFIFQGPYHAELHKLLSGVPYSLFYVAYAMIGSYVFGMLKGTADVFWRRKSGYRALQGVFWLVDAIPMFGLIVIVECASLYFAMSHHSDPFRMLPNNSFWMGDFLRANMLLVAPMMYISRITAIALDHELGEDYVLTARSKGLHLRTLFRRHLFANLAPKLLNEVSNVFVLILSSLLALEYLSFQDKGFMFGILTALGQGALGQVSLYIDQMHFFVQDVSGYLVILALFTTLFHLFASWLNWRWKGEHNYEG